jgi:hypothetical protein
MSATTLANEWRGPGLSGAAYPCGSGTCSSPLITWFPGGGPAGVLARWSSGLTRSGIRRHRSFAARGSSFFSIP